MRALVWHGERSLGIEDVPDPVPEDGEVVLDVELAGICGSDLHGYRGHPGPRVPPLVLGHEVVGHVEGGRYTVYPLLACGLCDRCLAGDDNLCDSWQLLGMHRPGVFAEWVAVPRRLLVPVPTGLDAGWVVLAEPLACCIGALRPHRVGLGSRVVVFGCGPLGLLTVYLASREGAEVVAVEPLAERRTHAERLGVTRVVPSAHELGSVSADVAVDAAGFQATWRGAIDAVRSGGAVVVLGLGQAEGSFPMALVVRRAIALRGQFAYSRADFARAVELLAAGDLDLGWTAEVPLDSGVQAFANLVDRPEAYVKVLLRP